MADPQLQISEFKPQTIYDAPETLFSQLVDRELSAMSAVDTVFRPDRLTLKERTGLKERLQEGMGGTRIGNALTDIALNPWVWAAVAMGPAGSKALSRGESIFEVNKKFSPFSRENAPFLSQFGLLGPDQATRGSAMMPIFAQVTRDRSRLGKEFRAQTKEAHDALAGKAGIRGLDPDAIRGRHTEDQRATTERIGLLVQGKLEGWEKRFRQVIDDGSEATVNPLVQEGSIDEIAQSMGIEDELNAYTEALQKGMRTRLIRLYGDESEELVRRGEFVADPDKIVSVLQGAKTGALKTSSAESDFAEQLKTYLGEGLVKEIRDGGASEQRVLDKVSEVFTRQIQEDGVFFPRKIRETLDETGRNVVQADSPSEVRFRAAVSSTKGAAQRQNPVAEYNPDDLESVRELFGDDRLTDSFRRRQRDAVSKKNRAEAKGEAATFFRIKPMAALNKYLRDTDNTFAFYVSDVSDEVRVAAEDSKRVGSSGMPKPGPGRRRVSLMDVLGTQHDEFTDPWAQKMVSEVMLPMASGTHKTRNWMTMSAMLSTKQALRGFADSNVGKLMEDSHPLGKKMIRDMRTLADPEAGFRSGDNLSQQASRLTSGLASYLYVTHLGINAGSVMLNASQPFLLAVPFLARNPAEVGRAYKKSMGQFFSYANARRKQNFRFLDDVDKDALIKEHIPDADELGITSDTFHLLDEVEQLQLRGPGGLIDRTGEWMMKGFEKAEWMNRLVSRNLVEEAFKSAGRGAEVGGARFRNEVQQVVASTQFGGSRLNAPAAFLTDQTRSADGSVPLGGPLAAIGSNALARQFLQFTTRSFTGVFETGAKLGGQEFGEGLVRTFARGMGVSAMGNAVMRDIMGVDFERGLFASATFDILAGDERFGAQPSPVRLPPIADIPFDLVTAFASGDAQLAGSAAARLVPGGVAVQRATKLAPELPDIPFVDIQKTFVDYSKPTEDGRVPVFRSDGALIEFKRPSEIVMAGLGADLGRFNSSGALDGFLVQQNEQMRDIRGRAVVALRSGEVEKFESLKQQFESRFGLPMTISERQLDRSIRTAETPRTERILDILPAEVREAFTQASAESDFAGGVGRLGISEEELLSQPTSGRRDDARPQTVNREAVNRGRRAITPEQQEQAGPRESESFSPFDGF